MGNVYKLVSVYQILGKLKIDFEHLTYFNEDHFIEWIADTLKHIGAYSQLVTKEAIIEITNHKGLIPCDCYKVIDYWKTTSTQDLPYHIGAYTEEYKDYYLKRVSELQEEINNSSDIETIKVLKIGRAHV